MRHTGSCRASAAITINAAYHQYRKGAAKGSIEPGKLADLAVLSMDIFHVAPAEIEKARVTMTVFDGTVIYQDTGSSPTP